MANASVALIAPATCGEVPSRSTVSASPATRTAPALRVRGRLERHQGVINLLAVHLQALPLTPAALLRSRDFH